MHNKSGHVLRNSIDNVYREEGGWGQEGQRSETVKESENLSRQVKFRLRFYNVIKLSYHTLRNVNMSVSVSEHTSLILPTLRSGVLK